MARLQLKLKRQREGSRFCPVWWRQTSVERSGARKLLGHAQEAHGVAMHVLLQDAPSIGRDPPEGAMRERQSGSCQPVGVPDTLGVSSSEEEALGSDPAALP